jgi:putative molybdopterin biosynthesis protein
VKEFRDLASPEAAREAIASLDIAPDPETVPLAEARGRVLAERVDAGTDVPGFDRASMDGYAVRARDTFDADEADPVTLDLVGSVHAGETPDVTVGEGAAAAVSTGAVMPDGADAVVMVEETSENDGGVDVRTSVTPGEDVMLAGADVAAGERALGPGTRLTAREIGLLSALGVEAVAVRGRPTVGIVSTGDELVRPGDELDHRRGQIHDVNSYAIAAAVEAAGGNPELYPHVDGAATAAGQERADGPVRDDYDEMERVLRTAADECDLVLSSGSTSAGAVDVVYRVVEERGELLLHGVAVKPGKPTIVGRLDDSGPRADGSDDERSESSGDSAYVGLPGYPVSALTIFRTFVAPAIRAAAGLPETPTATVEGRMATRERYDEGRKRLMPVGLVEDGAREAWSASVGSSGRSPRDGHTLVYPVDKGSGATTSLVEADGVVAVDADTEFLAAGEQVTVELFSPDVRPPTLLGVGEDDPALARLLDALDRPRYLAVGSRGGIRRMQDGLPDVCVVAGPTDVHPAVAGDDGDGDEVRRADQVAAWSREWGLVVPAGNPEAVEGLADLVDRDLRLVNRRTESGLRASLAASAAGLADERGVARNDLVDAIDGWAVTTRAHESPARRVAAGDADAGLGLRATASTLDVGFVPLGEQAVRVLVHPDRVRKPGVDALVDALEDDLPGILDDLDGYG